MIAGRVQISSMRGVICQNIVQEQKQFLRKTLNFKILNSNQRF